MSRLSSIQANRSVCSLQQPNAVNARICQGGSGNSILLPRVNGFVGLPGANGFPAPKALLMESGEQGFAYWLYRL